MGPLFRVIWFVKNTETEKNCIASAASVSELISLIRKHLKYKKCSLVCQLPLCDVSEGSGAQMRRWGVAEL